MARSVFVGGATGYLGRRLATALLSRGHRVTALARRGSEMRIPAGCAVVIGDALDATTFTGHVVPCDTYVHLVGVAHPSPAKARQFETIDLASTRQALCAAVDARIRHFVFVSVARPAPVMRAYQCARDAAETLIRETGIPATILRPWYVLGPGHWWPVVLWPAYFLAERWPATRSSAQRLGLVTVGQMVATMTHVVEGPQSGWNVIDVPGIRKGGHVGLLTRSPKPDSL
ncbi:MAG: NAD(P)H-binding protein [Vicinamibacterales bacterium]